MSPGEPGTGPDGNVGGAGTGNGEGGKPGRAGERPSVAVGRPRSPARSSFRRGRGPFRLIPKCSSADRAGGAPPAPRERAGARSRGSFLLSRLLSRERGRIRPWGTVRESCRIPAALRPRGCRRPSGSPSGCPARDFGCRQARKKPDAVPLPDGRTGLRHVRGRVPPDGRPNPVPARPGTRFRLEHWTTAPASGAPLPPDGCCGHAGGFPETRMRRAPATGSVATGRRGCRSGETAGAPGSAVVKRGSGRLPSVPGIRDRVRAGGKTEAVTCRPAAGGGGAPASGRRRGLGRLKLSRPASLYMVRHRYIWWHAASAARRRAGRTGLSGSPEKDRGGGSGRLGLAGAGRSGTRAGRVFPRPARRPRDGRGPSAR
jgi:hypothetical protein